VHIRKWALGKHMSVLCFVSATGKTTHPCIVVEAAKLKTSWVSSYPEAQWGVDPAGYFSEGPFYDACVFWLKATEPVGGHAENPRVLFFDNYRSHIDPAVLKLLRAHNVRVVTFHPHTTHIFCVLDTSNFATFKRWLKSYFNDDELEITMNNIGELIRKAWEAATVITTNALTGTTVSAASKGFERCGLVPFSRARIDAIVSGKHDEIAKMFSEQKAKTAASGVPMAPAAKSIRLTPEERAAIVADFAKQRLEVVGYAATPYDAAKNRPTKTVSQCATGTDFIASLEAKQAAKNDEVAAKEERKAARKAAAAAKAVADAAKKAKVAEAAAEKAAAAAAKEQVAAAKAEAAAAAAAPKAGAKRAREGEDVAADPYARAYTKKK